MSKCFLFLLLFCFSSDAYARGEQNYSIGSIVKEAAERNARRIATYRRKQRTTGIPNGNSSSSSSPNSTSITSIVATLAAQQNPADSILASLSPPNNSSTCTSSTSSSNPVLAPGFVVSRSLVGSNDPLQEIYDEIQTSVTANKSNHAEGCTPESTLFAFDIDETVLVKSSGNIRPINRSPEIIKKMQDELGISTMPLTIRDAIQPDALQYLDGQWRSYTFYFQSNSTQKDLNNVGINLEKGTSLFKLGASFYGENGDLSSSGYFRLDGGTVDVRNGSKLLGLPHYKDGVLMASHNSKGEVLRKFLEAKKVPIQCIFFADDQADNISAVQQAFQGSPLKVITYTMPFPLK